MKSKPKPKAKERTREGKLPNGNHYRVDKESNGNSWAETTPKNGGTINRQTTRTGKGPAMKSTTKYRTTLKSDGSVIHSARTKMKQGKKPIAMIKTTGKWGPAGGADKTASKTTVTKRTPKGVSKEVRRTGAGNAPTKVKRTFKKS
jgi:hypothetical protein